MRLLTYLIIFYSLLLFFSCSQDDEILATYTINHKSIGFTRGEFHKLLYDEFNKESKQMPIETQKEYVSTFIIRKYLLQQAKKQNLQKDKDFLYFKQILIDESIRAAFKKSFYDRQSRVKEPFYIYSHLLLKNNNNQNIPAEYEKIKKIWSDITTGKLAFIDAVKKYSQDTSSKKNNGKLDISPLETMDPAIALGITHLRKLDGHKKLMVAINDGYIFTKANKKSTKVASFVKGQIFMTGETKDSFVRIKQRLFKGGSILKNKLKNLNKPFSISLPVKSQIGWHLIQINNVLELNKNEYVEYLQNQDDDSNMTSMASQYWKRLIDARFQKFEKKIFDKYGLQKNSITMPKNWKHKKNLIDKANLTITQTVFQKRLSWIIKTKKLDRNKVIKNKKILNKIYRALVLQNLYRKNSHLVKKSILKRYDKFIHNKTQKYLINLYKKRNWFNSIKVTQQQIIKRYASYKKVMRKSKKTKIEPISQLATSLERREYFSLVNKLQEKKKKSIYNKLKIKFFDDRFKENKI